MRVLTEVRDDATPVNVETPAQLHAVLNETAKEAQSRKMLVAIVLEADNGKALTIVLGGKETVVGFDHKGSGPYFASKGESENDHPVMTCFLNFSHHTEFSRRYVVPILQGVNAAEEFVMTRERPTCIQWLEL